MQNDPSQESKVVSILTLKNREAEAAAKAEEAAGSQEEISLVSAIKRNQEIQERMRKERIKANQAVLKSYRIKN